MKNIFKTGIVICQYFAENITLFFFLCVNAVVLLVLMHVFMYVFLLYIHFRVTIIMCYTQK